MNVSAWSIRNPIPAAMLFVMLTLAGLFSFQAMKVQNFPDLDVPNITIVASLPGAAPNQLENDVARKIENSLASLQGLKHIYTKVQDGTVSITAEFRIEKNTQEALDDVRSAVAKVRGDLPTDLREPIINKLELAGGAVLAFNRVRLTIVAAALLVATTLLGVLTPWQPSLIIVVLVIAALPLAALGGWWAAATSW